MKYSYKGKTPSFGWWVRFKRKDEKIQEFFSDNVFGSHEKALEEAIIFRDAIERELEIGKVSPGVGGSKSKSGIVGVNRTKLVSKKHYGTYQYYAWQAQWINEFGKREGKKFYISEHGEEKALRLAIEAREQGMAYTKKAIDPLFSPPKEETVKVWRYMDFTKFVSLLENRGLFFPVADDLGDPFEGSFSAINQKFRPLIKKHISTHPDDRKIGDLIKNLRKWVGISCWHINDQESAGMWKLYARSEEAICIQSTFKKLRECLPSHIKTGLVKYVDYNNQWIPESNLLAPFMYKRKSFEHEKELRAILNLSEIDESKIKASDISGDPPQRGKWVSVNLEELIEMIHVAPYAPSWFEELVKNVVKSYKLKKPVKRSSLDKEPIF